MTPFQRAHTPEEQMLSMRKELWGKWLKVDPEIRAAFPQTGAPEAYQVIDDYLRDLFARPVYRNDLYQVTV